MTWDQGPVGSNPLGSAFCVTNPSFFSQVGLPGALGGPNGMTIAHVSRNDTIGFGPWFFLKQPPNNVSIEWIFANWAEEHPLSGTTQSNKPLVFQEWIWMYVTDGTTFGDHRIGASGAPEVLLPQGYAQQPLNSITFGENDGYLGEVLVYDRDLSPAELALLTAYFDAKYGVLPYV